MITSGVISSELVPPSFTDSDSASLARFKEIGSSWSLLANSTFVSLPSSVLTSCPESLARNSKTSSGMGLLRSNALRFKMAIFVSRSGG